ncbi:MAG: hypothetical protein IJR50_01490 [Treponema sp.]|nr:hypothetical protein [Treponema sp.]
MAKYIKKTAKITTKELQKRLTGKNLLPEKGSEKDFPPWLLPYIRSAYLAGKLTDSFTVPKGADINDYSLPVLGFIQKARIDFPDEKLAKMPENFFPMVKEAIAAKKMDQYGKVVSPEDLDDIPESLWPYVRPCFRLYKLFRLKQFTKVVQVLK